MLLLTLLTAVMAIIVNATPVPVDTQLEKDLLAISVRGNVTDKTDLSKDIISDSKVTPFNLLGSDAQFLETETDRLLYKESMSSFLISKAKKDPAQLDWTDDGCSGASDDPLGFNFLPCCQRHDFGYRNYKAQKRFTDANRLKVDDQFKKDMYAVCKGDWACEIVADTYYAAVRAFGALLSDH